MIPGTIFSFVPLLLGLFAVQPGMVGQSVTRLVVQDEVILRVPLQPRQFGLQIEWTEHKGPKCIPAAAIQRAFLSGTQQVDFILVNNAAFVPSSTKTVRRSTSTAASTCSRRTSGSAPTATRSTRAWAEAARSTGSGSSCPRFVSRGAALDFGT